jgi:putative NIF3 family GTP cyclohydrolase 1 type 2
MDVLKHAADANCNFVITHEPTFYGHNDDASRLGEDGVVAAKLAFIKKHNLVVWRFHDHWHRHQPDGVVQGMVEALGLGKQRRADEKNLFDVPEATVREFAAALKKRLGARVVRVVGDPEMKFTKVALVVGAPGGLRQMNALQRDDVEVLLAGESPEWETTEYVRDAMQQGRRKAVVFLGHTNSEEAGMKHCAAWLKGFVADVPIKFIPAGDPFWTP